MPLEPPASTFSRLSWPSLTISAFVSTPFLVEAILEQVSRHRDQNLEELLLFNNCFSSTPC